MIVAEYIWLDVSSNFRSKARTLHEDQVSLDTLPYWNYDGSSTGQAKGDDSEITLKPVSYYNCPFRGKLHGNNNIIVLCATYDKDGNALDNNNWEFANELFNKDLDQKPWYGLEQEYFIIDPKTNKPVGYNDEDTDKQGKYYCGVGNGNVFYRNMVNEHYMMCLHAGIRISGINAEVAPGQWEYQVGPVEGIEAGNQLLISRYILIKIAEKYGLNISFHPKPLSGNWNGSGCHANFSTVNIREGSEGKTGLKYIEEAIEKLSRNHEKHMKIYGQYNNLRMTGEHETSSFDKFSFGRANRGCSVRIPNTVINDKKGYFEDRRPSSNCDPYMVTGMIFKTCCL